MPKTEASKKLADVVLKDLKLSTTMKCTAEEFYQALTLQSVSLILIRIFILGIGYRHR